MGHLGPAPRPMPCDGRSDWRCLPERSAGGWSAGVLAGRSAGRLASWSADGPELLRLSASAGDATAAKCAMAWLLAAQSDVRRTTRGRC